MQQKCHLKKSFLLIASEFLVAERVPSSRYSALLFYLQPNKDGISRLRRFYSYPLSVMDLPEDCRLIPATDRLEMKMNRLNTENNLKICVPDYKSSFDKNRVNLQWEDITYKSPNGVTILKHLNGSSKSGEMTAIMGPSGSGKTSLLNILSGFSRKRMTGQILVNGTKRDMSTFRRFTCYVLQDDNVLPRLTVREIITFASKLKIPSGISEKERQKAVDAIIHRIGLADQQHQKASTLSGGQRKRLCIAQEILNNPQLLFLDEPTSGFDSASCLQCIQLLKSMAEKGKNIICTIHQPSSRIFEIFDNLYMISDGACIYRGPTKNLVPYLAAHNLECSKFRSPTDFLTDIAIGHYGDSVEKLKNAIRAADDLKATCYQFDIDNISDSGDKKPLLSMPVSTKNKIKEISQDSWQDISYATSSFNQFRVLIKRYSLHQLRDPIHFQLKIVGNILVGLLFGTLYYDNGNDGNRVFFTKGLLLTFTVLIVSSSMIPTILIFPLERAIFEREYRNGWYSIVMCYLATTAAELPYQIIFPAINSFLVYWLSGEPMEANRILLFMLSFVLIALISESAGLVLGCSFNLERAVYFSFFVAGIVAAFNGFLLPDKYTPVFYRFLCRSMYTKYGLNSIFLALYSDRPQFDCSDKMCFFREPSKFLNYLDVDENLLIDYIVMLVYFVIFRLLSFLLLLMRVSLSK